MTAMARIELLSELRRLKHKLGQEPSLRSISVHSTYSRSDFSDYFESWESATSQAFDGGSDPHAVRKDPLLAEMYRVARMCNEVPTQRQLEKYGDFPVEAYLNQFSSLEDAANKLPKVRQPIDKSPRQKRDPESGSSTSQRQTSDTPQRQEQKTSQRRTTGFPSEDELIAEFERVADELGHVPNEAQLRHYGRYTIKCYEKVGGVEHISEESDTNVPTEDDLLDELERLSDKLGGIPSPDAAEPHINYPTDLYRRRFGSWSIAVNEAGLSTGGVNITPIPDLHAELYQIYREIGAVPTRKQIRSRSEYSVSAYTRQFGTVANAVREAGLTPRNQHPRDLVPENQLLREVRRLYSELDEVPSEEQMDLHGRYDPEQYRRRFGSWRTVISRADISPNKRDSQQLIDELTRLISELDSLPTPSDMEEYGIYDPEDYFSVFGSWTAAIHAADRIPPDEMYRQDILREIHDLHIQLGFVPTVDQFGNQGEYTQHHCRKYFGSWGEALSEAGVIQTVHTRPIDSDDLLKEIRRLCNELGRVPSTVDMEKRGEYSSDTYIKRFETWADALSEAGVR